METTTTTTRTTPTVTRETRVLFIDSYEDLKKTIRSGNMDDRDRMWPVLPQVERMSGPKEYPDVAGSAERLISMLPARAITSFAGHLSSDHKHRMLLRSFAVKGSECKGT